MVFVNPQTSAADLDELYTNRNAAALIKFYSKVASPAVIGHYNQTLAWLEKLVPTRGSLLDFACGAGYFFEQASKRGWNAHGVDLGTWTAQAAQARGLANLHVGRLADLHFPDHLFDVVHATQVLEHLPRPRKDLAEIHRILRPGGLLYVDVPNYRTLPILLGMDDFTLNMPPEHINYFTPQTLRTLLRVTGFQDVRISSAGGLKWENLLRRRIKSHILAAAEIARPESSAPPLPERPRLGRSVAGWMKRAAVASLVRPVCYNRLRLGINLIAVARRP
jgi:SAM-dependent methyltransferase